jgi:hypothetical protein
MRAASFAAAPGAVPRSTSTSIGSTAGDLAGGVICPYQTQHGATSLSNMGRRRYAGNII